MYEHPELIYMLVIDTNDNAEKFAEQLVAFTIGYVGPSGKGKKEAQQFEKTVNVPLCKHLIKLWTKEGQVAASVWTEPTFTKRKPAYKSVAIFISQPFKDEEQRIIMQRAYEFAELHAFQITGFRVMKRVMTDWTTWKGKNL